MERFNLNTWLEDKSRKIVTRDGKQARIICYDVKQGKDDCYVPIIALVDKGEEIGEMSYYYSEDGSFLRNPNQTHNLDLFFADEEEELTDFEKAVEKTMPYKIPIYMLKSTSQQLLELARKEIEKENPYSGNQKQEWSEDDEEKFRDVIRLVEQGAPVQSIRDHYTNWLKALKDRFQLQPKQEWSEEDEKLYNSALWHIKNSCGNGGKDSGEFEVYNWLKSIKDRVQPKQVWSKDWKPSDEQMEALKLKVIGRRDSLYELYLDLENLKNNKL